MKLHGMYITLIQEGLPNLETSHEILEGAHLVFVAPEAGRKHNAITVSYTHLTLPTILRV